MIKLHFTSLLLLLFLFCNLETQAVEDYSNIRNVTQASTSTTMPPLAKDDYLKGLVAIEALLFILFLSRWLLNRRSKSRYKLQLKENIKDLRAERIGGYISDDTDKRRYRLKSEPLPAAGYANMIKKAKKLELSTGEIQLAARMRKLAKKYN
jgi:hypothetical protein